MLCACIYIVRIGVSVLADRQAPPRTWRQQVHLVRLDKHRPGLSVQSERAAREVEVIVSLVCYAFCPCRFKGVSQVDRI